MLLPKPPPKPYTEGLIHYHGISQSISSDQETYFTANEVQQLPRAAHWSYHVPHHPEAAGLIE